MASGRVSSSKRNDVLNKKIPDNPRYKHVKATVDTGASISRYMQKIEEIRKNYRYRKDELFKRIKISTFIQLVMQVAEVQESENAFSLDNHGEPADGLPLDDERDGGSPTPSLALTEGDFGREPDTSRSTLESVITGTGEIDMGSAPPAPTNQFVDVDCPYLLLDVRDQDAYDQCHIITAKHYPVSMLSRSVNSETKDIYAYKNQSGKIIVVYDDDERESHRAASTLVERGCDNLFMLSGGIKLAYRLYPEGLITGTPPEYITEKKVHHIEPSTQKHFTPDDLDKLNLHWSSAITDRSLGSSYGDRSISSAASSRLSKASTASSRMGSVSQMSSKSSTYSVGSRPPFK